MTTEHARLDVRLLDPRGATLWQRVIGFEPRKIAQRRQEGRLGPRGSFTLMVPPPPPGTAVIDVRAEDGF